MESKKNIGLFTAILENEYSSSIIEGAMQGARECDVNLIIFPIDLFDAKYTLETFNNYRYQYNVFHSYMDNPTLDGIIVEYGTITSFLDEARKREFLAYAGTKPMILLAERAQGYTSICMDNDSGLVEILEHLIVDHKYTKIAFLSGIKNNYDAEVRLNTYKSIMKKHGLYQGDDWVEYGNFSDWVEDEANAILDRHPDMEVLVCANDAMAIGAARAMKKRGIEPGIDIKITGFDNIPAGFLDDPSLTTVKADPQELARKAVHEIMKGDTVAKDITLKTKMVRRTSCGCQDIDLAEEMRKIPGASNDWRQMAKYQQHEDVFRHSLERELANANRELIFMMHASKQRYKEILGMMRRFQYRSCALFLYDSFIEYKKGERWINPEYVNLVGYYSDIKTDEDYVFEKGELMVPVKEIFDWGMVRDGNRHEILIVPLFFGEKQIGFIAVESEFNRIVYAADIAGQVSNILYTIAMNDEQERMKHALEEANFSKSRFLANMSHEIRTPINAIIGFNEMIIRESNDPNIDEYANDVKNAADTLLMLVNDTLDFSKIEAGKMELIISDYKSADLLKGVIGMISSRAEKKGLDLLLEYDENMPSVLEGDSGRLQQILINLISNAIKYTEKGKVTVKVNGEANGDTYRLKVQVIDTGIGIKEEDIDRLFNRFERIEEKRNRNIEGTGLGINITTGLLKLMNSELKVKSTYGVGSEFSFEVDQKIIDHKSVKDTYSIDAKPEKKVFVPEFKAPNVKVLVVDDNFLNRKVMKSLLKETEIAVDEADSGLCCIEKVKENKYDIILLDHMMPQMDGVETLEIIKQDNLVNIEETPIIVLTANAIAGAREEYLQIGFTDYLAKPVLPKVLYEMLFNYIDETKIQKI